MRTSDSTLRGDWLSKGSKRKKKAKKVKRSGKSWSLLPDKKLYSED